MREIRFRAWDKRSQFMFYNVQNGITFDDESHYKFSDFLEDADRWEVMQYTGLKDKNGNEVYEGDIVSLEQKLYEVIGNIYEHPHLLDNNDQND